MTTTNEMRWEAPGPGVWELESAHFPRPMPRFGRTGMQRGFATGFAESTARYGLLLSHFDSAFVNDFLYQKPAPFGAPKDAKGPPPAPILWLLTRLHPAMRARIKVSAEAFEKKTWRDDLRRWDEVDKPASLKRHEELLACDPATLDDEALALHLREVEAHFEAMIVQHHRYTVTCCLPVGDLLAHVTEWTGESAASILEMLRGSTPVSRGILADELRDLVAALESDPAARAILDGHDARASIEALSACADPVGKTARTFFERMKHRALSYDIGVKAAGEMPEMLIGAVRASVKGTAKDESGNSSERIKAIREKIPAQHQATFDALVAEARLINRLRDERGIYSDGFAVGISRRAILEAGARLTSRGLIDQPDHAVDLDVDEVILHLLGPKAVVAAGTKAPSAAEVRERVIWRTTKSVADAPAFLGGTPSGPPDPGLLPTPARRAAKAIDAMLTNLFKEAETTSTATVIRGLSVNQGVYEGTARIIEDASQFDRLKQGDVLVTRATAPYFNVVLPLLGAIVTDRGGQLCHAAIVAREYGIPGVIGTKEATKLIPDGARVRVDGTKGEVTVLSVPAALAAE
jgi:phosphohistidine swiveling domain-containing protein